MKKLLKSLLILGIVGLVGYGVTQAFFSDEEKSTGNTFIAGTLDLLIDSTCHYNGNVCTDGFWTGNNSYPVPGTSCSCTWLEKNLETGNLFFNFDDLKPGDTGEDTISLHVDNNDSYVCAEISELNSVERGCNEPEEVADSSCSGDGEGELQDYLLFTIWKDNGEGENSCNNVLDSDEVTLITDQPAANGIWPIADSQTGGLLGGDTTNCIGVSWRVPSDTGNIIQGDMLTADISFSAIQARHLEGFRCGDLNEATPTPEPPTSTPVPPTPTPVIIPDVESICDDRLDNDGDFETDCADSDCLNYPLCSNPNNLWINEIHYDNTGTDTNEGVEIAGPAGKDLTGWSIVLYNGDGGAVYNTKILSGVIPNLQAGYGTVWFDYPTNGVQNGSPDGIALVASGDSVIQFLSYEGTFIATNGPANGMNSTDIGVDEDPVPQLDYSLQLQGTGNEYSDFTWVGPIGNTRGAINTNQTFN